MPRAAGRRVVLLSVSLLASCAWAGDRAVDLADVFVLEASAGLGVAADVKATDLAHGGFRHEVEPGAFHIYRIVRGPSWSGFVYVNLQEEGR